ncbi:MAG: hypothetical protein JEZ07_14515 [Phycisphaerae bacterium]|nr:hypothetical protein [Phycisphaerae bacterium]
MQLLYGRPAVMTKYRRRGLNAPKIGFIELLINIEIVRTMNLANRRSERGVKLATGM